MRMKYETIVSENEVSDDRKPGINRNLFVTRI